MEGKFLKRISAVALFGLAVLGCTNTDNNHGDGKAADTVSETAGSDLESPGDSPILSASAERPDQLFFDFNAYAPGEISKRYDEKNLIKSAITGDSKSVNFIKKSEVYFGEKLKLTSGDMVLSFFAVLEDSTKVFLSTYDKGKLNVAGAVGGIGGDDYRQRFNISKSGNGSVEMIKMFDETEDSSILNASLSESSISNINHLLVIRAKPVVKGVVKIDSATAAITFKPLQ